MTNTALENWETYKKAELSAVTPSIHSLGYDLDDLQPHLSGERYLMQAVTTTSGRKLILLGRRRSDSRRVVIKVSSDPGGIHELEHERLCRARLQDIKFAYRIFLTPEELYFGRRGKHVISIQAYIEQEQTFLARTTPEQFTLALSAFKAQEGAHAATYEHARDIARTFGSMNANDYLKRFAEFRSFLLVHDDDRKRTELLEQAEEFLTAHAETIEQYSGFLTHSDFVPHNLRIVGTDIYLLDHSSLRFGNKYEGWARFINFMTLYNPELATALTTYVADNRTPEESEALRLMRVYRLGEIITYYTDTLSKSEGDLLTLNTARIDFWTDVLTAVLARESVSAQRIDLYKQLRESLRSPEEKLRQKDLH